MSRKQKMSNGIGFTQVWKQNDQKAQKSGIHKAVYQMQRKHVNYEDTIMTKLKSERKIDSVNSTTGGVVALLQPCQEVLEWQYGSCYTGDWQDNLRHGKITFKFCAC